ncbi:hypothetical protein GALMADRAFT_1273040 [Galerina marginata CBS 339.88]|uniref:F-box domain-containing protein n=1 Tax=Galerina marginata (strain CBS 339.88) TaxID=685588 RepID=A0A067T8Z6_GALM3|nr:hypothetical protein GALMADRAFT_1273040 [Galerina marginata CBS 339.88]
MRSSRHIRTTRFSPTGFRRTVAYIKFSPILMTSIITLPHEIQQQIFDYYRGDARTLKLLSLTCRCFLPICQSLLFSEIVLFPPSNHKGVRTGPRFQVLLELSPHIARYVRTLEIVDTVVSDASLSVHSDESLENCLPELRCLRALVVRMQTIMVDRARWVSLSRGLLLAALLVTLDLPTLEFLDISSLPLALVNYCHPNLKHLAFELGEKETLQTMVPFDSDAKVVLESLEVQIKFRRFVGGHSYLRDSLGNRVDITKLKRLYFIGGYASEMMGHLTFWSIVLSHSGSLIIPGV